MRIASYSTAAGASFGLVVGDKLIDLGRRVPCPDISAALAAGALGELERHAGAAADFALSDVALLPAVPSLLRKVLCVGLNYRAHVAESAGREVPENPRIFARLADTIIP